MKLAGAAWFSIVLASSVPASSAIAQTAPSPAPADAQPVKEKKVCRREAETGSYISHATCHTRAEWAQIDNSNAAGIDSFNKARHGSVNGLDHPGSF